MRRCLSVSGLFLSALLLALGFTGTAHGQGVTTAAITGTVTDNQAQPLPGIQIVVTQVATGRVAGTITRGDGRFLLPGLQPGGPYRIEARGIGYSASTEENVQLALGQTARFDFALAPAAVAIEGIAVTSERDALISRGRTGTGASIGRERLERQPTITRNFTEMAVVVPQVSTAGAGTSAGGRNNRFNNIQIDGAVNNDLFGLAASGTPGGQAGARPITMEAIQEVQVVIAPFDVRQSGFTGAGINAVTRSGTNDFSGSISYFNRNEGLVGRYNVPVADTASRRVGEFSQYDLAFSLGGPVLRDRLHFFTAGEISRRSAPTGFAIGQQAAIADSLARQFASVLQSGYNFSAGDYEDLNLRRNSDNFFGRLDFQINPDHRLTVRHNYVDAFDDNLPRANNPYRFSSNLYVFNSTTNSTVAQLNSNFGNRFFNEFRLGLTTIRDNREIPTNFPAVRVFVPGGSLFGGHEQFSGQNALDQDVLEVTNELTLPVGQHNFVVGTSNQFFRFSNLFVRNAFGYYEFPSLAALQAGTPNRYEFSYLLPNGRERAEFPVHLLSLYAQDRWSPMGNLTLTGGVRFEIPVFPDAPAQNQLVTQNIARDGQPVRTDEVPSGNLLINPRIGFNWDVRNDQATQLRGGIGYFSGRTPGVWVSNAYGNTGLDYARFTCTGAATPAFVPDPNNQPRSCVGSTALAASEINTIDPDFKLPQVLRYSLAVDQRLLFGLVGTLEGLFTTAVSDVLPQELMLGPPAGTIEGRTRWTRIDAPFSNAIDITNTDENRSYSVTAQVQRLFRGGWDFSAAYTYSRSEDVNSVTSSQAFSNWRFNPIVNDPNNPQLRPSNFDAPHRVLLSGSFEREFVRRAPTNISLLFIGESGQPFSYTYGGSGANADVNFDGSNGNDLIYVPASAAEIRFEPFRAPGTLGPNDRGQPVTPEQAWQNLNAFIEGVECLRDARGQVLQRNACRTPRSNRLDVRVAQSVPTVANQRLQISLDILNFGNMLNREWGRSEFVANQNDSNLLLVANRSNIVGERVLMQPVTRTPQSVFQIGDLGSRYQVQLGVRYAF
ncbi:TonB-dependent receptor [soil metagenome]